MVLCFPLVCLLFQNNFIKDILKVNTLQNYFFSFTSLQFYSFCSLPLQFLFLTYYTVTKVLSSLGLLSCSGVYGVVTAGLLCFGNMQDSLSTDVTPFICITCNFLMLSDAASWPRYVTVLHICLW